MSPDARGAGPAFRMARDSDPVTIFFEGAPICVPGDVSVAAALLVAGYPAGRRASRSGARRNPYCGIGQCFDCSMIIDGQSCRQACMTPVRDGMTVARQTV